MANPLSQRLNGIGSARDKFILAQALTPLYDEMSSQTLTSAGLVITGAGGTTAKTGAVATTAVIKGRLSSIAAGTSMAALSGSVTNGRFNVYAFYLLPNGTTISAMGTEATTLGGVIFPPVPTQTSTLGFLIVNPTGTGPFVGGTTPLDSAGVVPNAQYISIIGAFEPSATLS